MNHYTIQRFSEKTAARSLELFNADPLARFYHHPDWLLSTDRHLADSPLHILLNDAAENATIMFPVVAEHSLHRQNWHQLAHAHLSLKDVLVHPALMPTDDEPTTPERIDWEQFFHADDAQISGQINHIPQNSRFLRLLSASLDGHDGGTGSDHGWVLRRAQKSAWFDTRAEAARTTCGKLKRNLRRLRNRLTDIHTVEIRTVTEASRLDEAFQQFLDVENSGWKGNKTGTAIARDSRLVAFYRHLLTPVYPGLAPEINLLLCDGRCIAAQYGLRTGTTLSLLKICYAEEFGSFSPGSILLNEILEACYRDSTEELSLVTSPAWSERWHPELSDVFNLHYFGSSIFSRTHRFIENLRANSN